MTARCAAEAADPSRRDLLGGVVGLACAPLLATTATARVATRVAERPADVLALVHPELRALARQINAMAASYPAASDAALGGLRAGMDASRRTPLTTVEYVKKTIPGPAGSPPVTIYVINAKPGTSRPGILHTHGGGFIMGAAAADIAMLQETAAALDCAIVTVEYRLAPETRYLGSIEDNYAGLAWLHDESHELGVDRSRIAVMGESAGGGHAALLALAARDRGRIPVAFQCLVYPMLDDRTGSTRKVAPHIGTLLWTAPTNRYAWRSFLGREPGGSDVPAAAVPARSGDLARLPPTWIGVGSLDLFVDEDLTYARRLIDAAVPTELHVVPGAFHGFDSIAAQTEVAKRFTEAKLRALRAALT